MSTMPYVFFRGKIVPKEEAVLSIASHSLQYGSTCFTGMRGYVRNGKVHLFRLEEHYERLMRSLRIMGWQCDLSWEEFSEAVRVVIQKNQPDKDFYIRPFIFSEKEELQLDYAKLSFSFAIYLSQFDALFDLRRGIKLKISSFKKISDEMISTKAKVGGAYVNSALAATDAKMSGFDDALLLDRYGNVVELTGANIMIRMGEKIITPAVGNGILDGITLRSALKLLEEEGYKVHFEPIDRSMIYSCDELLLLGTAAGIRFVESVDMRLIGNKPGPLSQLLQKRYEAILEGWDKKSEEWITAIPIHEKVKVC